MVYHGHRIGSGIRQHELLPPHIPKTIRHDKRSFSCKIVLRQTFTEKRAVMNSQKDSTKYDVNIQEAFRNWNPYL